MKRTSLAIVLLIPFLTASCVVDSPPRLAYPETSQVAHVDDYHGTQVSDPYRWLEDLDSEETARWVEAQNRVTFGYLEQIPQREKIRERLAQLWNFEKYGVPRRAGSLYLFEKNDGLQNQDVLYVMDGLEGEPRVLLDPNTLSQDGTVALTDYELSPDGRYLAYGTARAGSDWQEWRIREVASSRDLEERLEWVKFSDAAWSGDSRGFYYSRYDEPREGDALEGLNLNQKVFYHQLETAQSEDRLIYQRPDHETWLFDSRVSEDGRYLILQVSEGTDTRKRVFYQDLRGKDQVVELLDQFDAAYDFVGNQGPVFWFWTDLEAPRGRLIAIDTRRPERSRWKTLIPEREVTLRDVYVINQSFLASSLQDAHARLDLFALDGTPLRQIELPGLGRVESISGKPDHREAFFAFSSFAAPNTVYRLVLSSGEASVFRQPDLAYDPEDYETRQFFYTSKDGTRVPMFITAKKGLELNGQHPTLLYGYGGFNIPQTPRFRVSNLAWMELGGVYAVANLRGGGEYGEAWHKAGTKLQKQNVFDDFIGAAEWLVANGYTRSSKLAIQGGSNGGLLVGAVMNQRPELFAAALPAVGVMDMLRFNKFTIGWAWESDYGSPEDPEEFQALYAYSPYHNLKDGVRYPSTLITTADHDDRVVPSHSFKFASRLQAAHAGDNPVLIRIETKAGHGAGKPTSKLLDEAADVLAFLVRELEVPS